MQGLRAPLYSRMRFDLLKNRLSEREEIYWTNKTTVYLSKDSKTRGKAKRDEVIKNWFDLSYFHAENFRLLETEFFCVVCNSGLKRDRNMVKTHQHEGNQLPLVISST